MADTDIDICNRALVMVRAATISSLSDTSTEGIVANALYEAEVEALLSAHRWTFSSTVDQLSRLAAEPEHKWDAAYQMPSLAIRVLSVYVNDEPIDYEIDEDNILCDALSTDEVYCDYIYRSLTSVWPPYFKTALQFRLAALFALPCGAQEGVGDKFEQLADMRFRAAKSVDAQTQTNPRLIVSRLVDARRTKKWPDVVAS